MFSSPFSLTNTLTIANKCPGYEHVDNSNRSNRPIKTKRSRSLPLLIDRNSMTKSSRPPPPPPPPSSRKSFEALIIDDQTIAGDNNVNQPMNNCHSDRHRQLMPLQSINMDIIEYEFENFHDTDDTIDSSIIQSKLINNGRLKQLERLTSKHLEENTKSKPKTLLINDLDLNGNKYLTVSNQRMFVSFDDARKFQYIYEQLSTTIVDAADKKFIVNQLLKMWQQYPSTSTPRLIYFYAIFAWMFRQYLQIDLCDHQPRCPQTIKLKSFKCIALPILKEFFEKINPFKKELLQIEMLAAIESLISHEQKYFIAVADIFDLLFKASLIDSHSLAEWSRLDDPAIYPFNCSQSSRSEHKTLKQSKSTGDATATTTMTIRALIIQQLNKNGLRLSID